MLRTKPQGHWPFGSGEEDFWRVFTIWAWKPAWSCDPDPANKFSFPYPTETPYEIWLWLAQRFWRSLKGFYHIWAWRPSWSCDSHPANKLSFLHPTETPHEIWLWLASWFWRRRSLKMVDERQMDNGRLLYYKLSNEPKGSGELKNLCLTISQISQNIQSHHISNLTKISVP